MTPNNNLPHFSLHVHRATRSFFSHSAAARLLRSAWFLLLCSLLACGSDLFRFHLLQWPLSCAESLFNTLIGGKKGEALQNTMSGSKKYRVHVQILFTRHPKISGLDLQLMNKRVLRCLHLHRICRCVRLMFALS